MSKSKYSIYVVNSYGGAWTTHRGARRLIQRGLASPDPLHAGVIHMIEEDPRFQREAEEAHAARLAVIVARNTASGRYRNEVLGLPNFVRTGSNDQRGLEV